MNKNTFNIIILSVIAVYIIGMFCVPLMDIDAAQYASISREMLERKSYLQLYDLGKDYLDKPPMLFWLSALSMKIFGIHDWAYRLPSFLFSLIAIYSTFRLAYIFYKKEIALLSALVLATSQAMFLINHDVRTDTMLMGWVTFSLWQLAAWYATKKWKNFLLGFIAIAGGMMTKGPIALMVPAFALVPHFILRREWKNFFRWEYLLGILIIAIALIPMSIGLYEQYDMHPGKIINNVPIKSGLRFYYWTQSFGRYTGENVFKEMNDFTFLLQNMLWSFLPWIIFFLIGLLLNVVRLVQDKFKLTQKEEWITTGGFIVTYCVLARSQAQLPHYIFVVFPLASIVTAKFLYKLLFTSEFKKLQNVLSVFHFIIFGLLWLAVIVLMYWSFATIPKFVSIIAAIGFIGYLIIIFRKKVKYPKLLLAACFTTIGINIFLNTSFYPSLLLYQRGNTFASYIQNNKIDKNNIVLLNENIGHSLHFYSNHIYPIVSLNELNNKEMVIARKDSLPLILQHFPTATVVTEIKTYGVTQLSLPFLNPKFREKELIIYDLIKL
ncbi:MAG: glycosyltransferase family 39 protein [Bacteroidetes bacterium]|nr:glycosyltransferase family 39 protein [Bacteroidota bacterium]